MYLEIILTLILLLMVWIPVMIILWWFKVGRKIIKTFSGMKNVLNQKPNIETPPIHNITTEQKIEPPLKNQQPPMPDISQLMGMVDQFGKMFGNNRK
jgi:hypothetical protein